MEERTEEMPAPEVVRVVSEAAADQRNAQTLLEDLRGLKAWADDLAVRIRAVQHVNYLVAVDDDALLTLVSRLSGATAVADLALEVSETLLAAVEEG